MANWEMYKIVDGDEQYEASSDSDVFVYEFNENKTDKNEEYKIYYTLDNGEQINTTHVVYSGDCVEERTECTCDNIKISGAKTGIILPYQKGTIKTWNNCYVDNGCEMYFEIEYITGTQGWLECSHNNETGIITFKTLSEANGEAQERKAKVHIYSDENKTNECTDYSVEVFQESIYKIKYEVYAKVFANGVTPKQEKIYIKNVILKVDSESISITTPEVTTIYYGKYNAYSSGQTSVIATSLHSAITKISWIARGNTATSSKVYYNHLIGGCNSYRELKPIVTIPPCIDKVQYKGTLCPSDTDVESCSLLCRERERPNENDDLSTDVCACAEYSVKQTTNDDEFDILAQFKIENSSCDCE